ncbi:MAG: hypothetical protein CFH41_00494 [Alphaproteobacteria bacterium MarineAlpha11_Bin1]|nr:MAG: hypothetical protein CFH41_00494 [Alphaproteobacteria bacterium MarineAlpha11_Bin1]|tara:strand:+ start:1370 stop:3082 length:1713 start_codon:yes stop_codon:yes gene_type:complete
MVRFSLFAVATAAVLCAIWRTYQFGDIDLVSDQAFFTQWVRRLSESTHLLPPNEEGGAWPLELIRDERNFLGVLLGQIYQAHSLIFTVVSVLLYLISAAFFGASVETIVAVSIAFSATALFLLSAFPAFIRNISGISDRGAVTMIAIILVLACSNSFFNVFSAFGPHNAGVMTLILAVIVTQIWVTPSQAGVTHTSTRLLTIAMFVSQLAAVYTHYANVFILPAATVMALALQPNTELLKRVVSIIKYSLIMVLAFLPWIAVVIVYDPSIGGGNSKQTFGGQLATFVFSNNGWPASNAIGRITHWFKEASAFYSVPGLALGMVGVVGLAWRNGTTLPFTIVLTHILMGIFLGIFGQYDRTVAYLIPMLILGGGWTIYIAGTCVFEKTRPASVPKTIGLAVASLVAISTTLHIAVEIPRLMAPDSVKNWGPLVGPSHWKSVVAEFDRRIPIGSYLIPWDYGTHHQYRSMSEKAGHTIKVMRPLETLDSHGKSGTLKHYIHSRGLTLSADNPVFILAPKTIEIDRIRSAFSAVVGQKGFGLATVKKFILVGERTLPRRKHGPGGIHLYLVKW